MAWRSEAERNSPRLSDAVLRGLLLNLANRQAVYRLVMRHDLLRGMAWRFVAGETLRDAIRAVRSLSEQGCRATLDHLGESVRSAPEARAAADEYVRALETLAAEGLEANVSLKLTQMGLDVDPVLCEANLRRILSAAQGAAVAGETFVRMDMESSVYTDRTLDLHERLWSAGCRTVGVVLQAYLYRTPTDLEREIGLGARVRLCKGAYLEPPEVAFPDKARVDASFARLAERLLDAGVYPALATHDERLIRHAQKYARRSRIPPARFEFQMLFGVRRDLQRRLVEQGYNVRVYVPYGRLWYPYLTRRLAERPANLAFFLRALAQETLTARR